MAQLKGGTTIAGFKAWHYGNLRINSSGQDVTHLTPVTFTEDITISKNAILASGKAIVSGFNSGAILKDQGNGNVELNAAGGHLYLGSFNTGVIRLSSDLKTGDNTNLIATTAGVLYDQGIKLSDKYAQIRRIEVTLTTASNDWVTIATATGRGSARFFLADETAGEHGHLEFYAGVSFGSDPYINVVGYGSFTGNGNGMITGLRFLQEDADAVYGTYKLQAQFKAGSSQKYTAAIFEDILPFQQWDLLSAWTEFGSPVGWSNRVNIDLAGSTTSGFITTGDMIVKGSIKEGGANLSSRYLRKDANDTITAITSLAAGARLNVDQGELKFGNIKMHTSGDSNGIHFSGTGGVSLIPGSNYGADIGRASYRWGAGFFGDVNADGDFILHTSGASYLKAVDSVGTKRNLLWLGGTDIVEMGDAALTMQLRAAGAIQHFNGTTTNYLIHSGGGQTINGDLTTTGITLAQAGLRTDGHIILKTNGSLSKLIGTSSTNTNVSLAYVGPADITVFGDNSFGTYLRGSYLTYDSPTGQHEIIHSGGNQTIADELTISGVGDTVLRIEADPGNIDEDANPSLVLSQDGGAITSTIALTNQNRLSLSTHKSGINTEVFEVGIDAATFNFKVAPTYLNNGIAYDGRALTSLQRLHLTGTGDAGLASTAHPFQIGLDTGLNVAFDPNEIQARDNGSAAALNLNAEGGNVVVNGSRVLTEAYGTATNADKLDNLDSTQFIRSDANDVVTGHTNWNDTYQIRMGTDNDLTLSHSGVHGNIINYTGDLSIEGRGSNAVFIRTGATPVNIISANGGVAKLYESGNERLATTTTGTLTTGTAIITGSIGLGGVAALSGTFNNGKAIALGDNDTGIRQNGDGVLELWTNNTAHVTINPSGHVTTAAGMTLGGSIGVGTSASNFGSGPTIAIGDTDTGICQNGDGTLELWTNGVSRIVIDRNLSTTIKNNTSFTDNVNVDGILSVDGGTVAVGVTLGDTAGNNLVARSASISLGDKDSGFAWNSAGSVETWYNNATATQTNGTGFRVLQGDIIANNNIVATGDITTSGDVVATGDITTNTGRVNLTASASVEFDSSTNSIDFVFA